MAVFYGFRPSNWLDEELLVHVRFRDRPPDEVLVRLGRRAATFPLGEIGFRIGGDFAGVQLYLPHGKERQALDALRELLVDEAGALLIGAIAVNV